MKEKTFGDSSVTLPKFSFVKLLRGFKLIKQKRYVVIVLFLLLVLSLLAIPIPLLTKKCIDVFTERTHEFSYILKVCLVILGLYLLKFIITLILQFYSTVCIEKVITDLKQNAFELLIKSNRSFLSQQRVGYLTKRIEEIDGVRVFFSPVILKQVVSLFEFIFAFVILFSLHKVLALVAILLMPPFYFITKKSSEGMLKASRDVMEQSANLSASMTNIISGAEAIKNTATEEESTEEINLELSEYYKKSIIQQILSVVFTESVVFLAYASTVIVLLVSGYFILKGEMSIGTYIAASNYVAKVLVPVQSFAGVSISLLPAFISLDRLEEFYLLKSEHTSFSGKKILQNISSIEYDKVSFAYDDNEIFKDLSFNLTKGTKTLIIGKNGSGKTTISRLLLAHSLPSDGVIKVNEFPYTDYSVSDLRKNIGIASQQIFLFNNTISYNISLSNESDDGINQLITKIGLKEYFEKSFPDGLNTQVGENGMHLSGGQKQIISILRMLYFKPSMIILDESFSNVDVENRGRIIDYFNSKYVDSIIIYLAPEENNYFTYDMVIRL